MYGHEHLVSLSGGTGSWYNADALGSVRLVLSDTGTTVGRANYDPWGGIETSTVGMFGFTGELHDVNAGLVNLRARWYSTARGRFTTQDTWTGEPTQPGSFNQYSYTENNPVNRVDPAGHTWYLNQREAAFAEELFRDIASDMNGYANRLDYGGVFTQGADVGATYVLEKAAERAVSGFLLRGLATVVSRILGPAAYCMTHTCSTTVSCAAMR